MRSFLPRMDKAEIESMAAKVRTLSPRELEVFRLAADTSSTRQIAERLGVVPRTIEIHKGRIMAKLGVPRWSHVLAFRQLQLMRAIPLAASRSEAAKMAEAIADDLRQIVEMDEAAGGAPSERLRIIRDMVAAVARG